MFGSFGFSGTSAVLVCGGGGFTAVLVCGGGVDFTAVLLCGFTRGTRRNSLI